MNTLGTTILAGLMLASSPLSADTYYWNDNSPTWNNGWTDPVSLWGGTGWRWSTTPTGTANVAFNNSGDHDAVFTKANPKIAIWHGATINVRNVSIESTSAVVTFSGTPNEGVLNNNRLLNVTGEFVGDFRLDNSNTPSGYSLTVALNNADSAKAFSGTATFVRDSGGLASTVGDTVISLNHVNATGLSSQVAINAKGTLRLGGTPSTEAIHRLGGLSGSSAEGRIDDGLQAYSGTKVLRVEQNGASTLAASIVENNTGTGTLGLTKAGTGTLTLTGLQHTYSGDTVVEAGALIVNGVLDAASTLKVAADAQLGGSGVVGAISGAGELRQSGNGQILTASSLNGSQGLDLIFRFTQTTTTYADATNSGNDLLRLTAESPFTLALSADNQITVDFSSLGGTLALGQVYTGGFFVDSANFLGDIELARFIYLGLDPNMSVAVSTIAQSASFGDGWVTQFTITPAIPEPSTYAFLAMGLVGGWVLRWRRRVG